MPMSELVVPRSMPTMSLINSFTAEVAEFVEAVARTLNQKRARRKKNYLRDFVFSTVIDSAQLFFLVGVSSLEFFAKTGRAISGLLILGSEKGGNAGGQKLPAFHFGNRRRANNFQARTSAAVSTGNAHCIAQMPSKRTLAGNLTLAAMLRFRCAESFP